MSYLGENVPKLGFGLMRLPHVDNNMKGPIDIEQVKQMVDMFIEGGGTYFDTAFGYEGSEAAIKEALVDRYPRDKYLLATKLPAWAGPKTAEEAKQMFYTSLERCGVDYFDFYLLHNIDRKRMWAFDDFGMWDFVKELKQKGLVKHIGFSFHDHPFFLDEVFAAHPEMEFVQLQVNYADWDDPVVEARENCAVAAKHGKPVVIMEPLRGGKLCNLPAQIAELFESAVPGRSQAEWGLRFCRSLDNVITVLSGMSNVEQMQANLAIFANDDSKMSAEELATIEQARKMLNDLPRVPCTDCRYCVKDCPKGIPIPGIFDAYNQKLVYGDENGAKFGYMFATTMSNATPASECIGCGTCEGICPQQIKIIDYLAAAAEALEPEK